MAIPGQRFELNLDADDFAFDFQNQTQTSNGPVIKEIHERESSNIPSAPQFKATTSGFPEHRRRKNVSAFRQKQHSSRGQGIDRESVSQVPPSDHAIVNHISKKHGHDFEAKQKADINEENKQRIAQMTSEDIEEARAELTQHLSPAFLQRLMKRANIEEDTNPISNDQLPADQSNVASQPLPCVKEEESPPPKDERVTNDPNEPRTDITGNTQNKPQPPTTHFPVPPRNASDFRPLDPSSDTFLNDLRTTYFPDLAHDPSTLPWLQDPTPDDLAHSPYAPNLSQYPASTLRFDFHGNLLGPETSLSIPISAGLHHHGDAPSSAGYTIPELTLLSRSSMPSQRCVAYQVIGRIVFRLGRGDFGPRGGDLSEALWDIIERERILEVVMAEASRLKTHASAKAHATEALWLWRRGGGGERGLRKEGERVSR